MLYASSIEYWPKSNAVNVKCFIKQFVSCYRQIWLYFTKNLDFRLCEFKCWISGKQ